MCPSGLLLRVQRSNLAATTLSQLKSITDFSRPTHFHVAFLGEPGIDFGGLRNEFFPLAAHELFAPDRGMFKIVNEHLYWFNEDSSASEEDYEAVGTLIGLACANSVPVSIRLPVCLFRHLRGEVWQESDLEEMAPEQAESLRGLQQLRDDGGDVSEAGLTFVSDKPVFEGGEDIEVTNENFDDYVSWFVHHYLYGRVASKIDAFERGFRKCGDFRGLTPEQLVLRVSGETVYNWVEWRNAATYNDCSRDTDVVRWFWEMFEELSEPDKRNLLLFATGNDGVPVGGLKEAAIRIQLTDRVDRLPFVHVCSKLIDLPRYGSKEELRHKLMIAIENPVGFGAA
jgi:hypothetical protein